MNMLAVILAILMLVSMPAAAPPPETADAAPSVTAAPCTADDTFREITLSVTAAGADGITFIGWKQIAWDDVPDGIGGYENITAEKTFTVTENGWYAVVAQDGSGRYTNLKLEVSNIKPVRFGWVYTETAGRDIHVTADILTELPFYMTASVELLQDGAVVRRIDNVQIREERFMVRFMNAAPGDYTVRVWIGLSHFSTDQVVKVERAVSSPDLITFEHEDEILTNLHYLIAYSLPPLSPAAVNPQMRVTLVRGDKSAVSLTTDSGDDAILLGYVKGNESELAFFATVQGVYEIWFDLIDADDNGKVLASGVLQILAR
jgi:hypothetical protein